MAHHNGTISAPVDSAFGRLVEDLTARLQAGDAVDWSAVERDHPAHADELAAVRPALEMLGCLSRASDAAVSGVASAADDGIAGVLGDFRIVREVGRGGMGVVYEAEQLSLDRRVALKVLPYAGALDAKQLQRFKNEAKAAASLKHEHIVQVHAIGCERGVHFYAMEFIDGQTLAHLTAEINQAEELNHRGTEDTEKKEKTGPKSSLCSLCLCGNKSSFFRGIAELIADAADALEFAHSMGIVHRDVKPGNLMVDAAGKLWVADFGLARFGTDAGLTMTGDLLGTLRYMAPEQAMAKHGLADHRVDVYGLGCTLYELLTGKPAVDGTDQQEILSRIAFGEPVAPRKYDKAIPAELETIALKCLAKEPRERYATAGELAGDLRRFLDDKPITAKPPSLWQQAARRLRRHPRAITAVFAALVAGVIGTTWGLVRAERQRATAESSRQDALQTLRETTDDVVEKLIGAKPNLGPDERAFLERTLERWQVFSSKQGDGPEARALRAEGLHRIAKLKDNLGDHQDAAEGFRAAITIREGLTAEFPAVNDYRRDLGQSYLSLGSVLSGQGRRGEAQQYYERALTIWEKLSADHPEVAEYRQYLVDGHSAIAGLFNFAGQLDTARTQVQMAIDVGERLVADFPTAPGYRDSLAASRSNLALLLRNKGNREDAKEQYEQALAIWERLARDFPARTSSLKNWANCRDNFGVCLGEMGRLDDAAEQSRLALAIRQRLAADFPAMPEYRSALARNYTSLGMHLSRLGKKKDGQEILRKAVGVEERLVEDYPAMPFYRLLLGASYCNLSGSLGDPGTQAESLECAMKAINLLTPLTLGDSRPADARILLCKSHWNAANAHIGLGHSADAIPSWDKALEFGQPAERPHIRALRAKTMCDAGRTADAIADMDAFIATGDWPGPQLYDFARVYSVASGKDEARREEYGRHAVELLNRAVSKGFTNAAAFANGSDLDPIRQRDDFKRLVEALPKGKEPARPDR